MEKFMYMGRIFDFDSKEDAMDYIRLAEANALLTSKDKVHKIKQVIFNDPATIILWTDGTKTVVKAGGDKFDPEKGLAMAIAKKALGNKGNYYETFKKYLPKEEK